MLGPLLRPFAADEMVSYPVGLGVNGPRPEEPKCVEAVA